MNRRSRNFVKTLIFVLPILAYLIFLRCTPFEYGSGYDISFSMFLSTYFGEFGYFTSFLIESLFCADTGGLLPIMSFTTCVMVSNIFGYFLVCEILFIIFEVFSFLPSIISHWVNKFKRGD